MNTGLIMMVGMMFLICRFPDVILELNKKRNIFSTIVYFCVLILVIVAAVVSGPVNRNIDEVLTYQKAIISQQLNISTETESLDSVIEKANDLIDFKGLDFDYVVVDVTDTIKELSVDLKGYKLGVFKVSKCKKYIVDMKTHTIEDK